VESTRSPKRLIDFLTSLRIVEWGSGPPRRARPTPSAAILRRTLSTASGGIPATGRHHSRDGELRAQRGPPRVARTRTGLGRARARDGLARSPALCNECEMVVILGRAMRLRVWNDRDGRCGARRGCGTGAFGSREQLFGVCSTGLRTDCTGTADRVRLDRAGHGAMTRRHAGDAVALFATGSACSARVAGSGCVPELALAVVDYRTGAAVRPASARRGGPPVIRAPRGPD